MLLVVGGLFFVFSKTNINSASNPSGTACFENGACLDLEIASTSQARETGLMNRSFLANNAGMLFVFDQTGKYSFWMKNTKIPLDMVWVDSNGWVVEIVSDAQPCTVDSCPLLGGQKDARFVVEANAGFVRQNGVRLNQKVEINGFVN
ncbi:MAG: DUF192 domain-containing protein [Candidatus Micrarchaeota archaeon]